MPVKPPKLVMPPGTDGEGAVRRGLGQHLGMHGSSDRSGDLASRCPVQASSHTRKQLQMSLNASGYGLGKGAARMFI